MAFIKISCRKILKNKWLYLCLFFGLLISVSLLSSIPIYSEAVLNRLLIKNVEDIQKESGKYPAIYSVNFDTSEQILLNIIRSSSNKYKSILDNPQIKEYFNSNYTTFSKQENLIKSQGENLIRVSILAKRISYTTQQRFLTTEKPRDTSRVKKSYASLTSVSSIMDHIKLIDGTTPSTEIKNNVYEVIIDQQMMKNFDLLLGQEYILVDKRLGALAPIKVKPVGLFDIKDASDPFWINFDFDTSFNDKFLIDESILKKDFIDTDYSLLSNAKWDYILDYHALRTKDLLRINEGFNDLDYMLSQVNPNASTQNLFLSSIGDFYDKKATLNTMMWSINASVIIMLLLYMFMICKLIMDKEKNEIALLNSRGAKQHQIVLSYLAQGIILSLFALLIGPFIGLSLSKILGSSAGFMEFVNRKVLVASIGIDSYIYSLYAIIAFLLTMFITSLRASKFSIVDHKRNVSRINRRSLWEKTFIDIILLAISIYGYTNFSKKLDIAVNTKASSDVPVDPLIFILPSIFILSIFLIFLRLYPYIVRLIYYIGRKKWSPQAYISLLQVSRSTSGYHFLMIFLAMTMSVGIFSATAARTINKNSDDKINYTNGSDVIMSPLWISDAKASSTVPVPNGGKSEPEPSSTKIQYEEPPLDPFRKLSGIDNIARVFKKQGVIAMKGNSVAVSNIGIMGIDAYDFGKVTWSRNDLLPYNINSYLNLLSSTPTGCIISKNLCNSLNLKPGNTIRLKWNNSNEGEFFIMATIDVWPSWNPKDNDKFVVANLPYIQDHMALEPYDIWAKLKTGATIKDLYKSIEENKVYISSIKNTPDELHESKISPFRLAINGTMTLSFLICGLICFIGFLLYWILSVNSRILQFGILRAMGLAAKKLIYMLIWEQLLTSGVSIIAGILIGFITSKFFVPFLQLYMDSSKTVPKFKVVSYRNDILNIYILVGFMLLVVLALLSYFISKIKIGQAVKLGEE